MCGPFGCAGFGLADEHVGAAPARHGHQSGFGAAVGEPAVGGGVAKFVGVESGNAGSLGSSAKGAAQPVVAEASPPFAEQAVDQVEIADLEGDDLPGPDAGFEHEPHELMSARSSSSVSGSTTG